MSAESDDFLLIQPRDPIVVRDGRPFSADPGARAFTLEWPLPQTVAGAVRTFLGEAAGFDWDGDGPERARRIAVHGPLRLGRARGEPGWTIYLPAPRDAVPYRDDGGVEGVMRLVPEPDLAPGEGCDLPHPALRPLQVPTERKPRAGLDFWSLQDTLRWLEDPIAEITPGRHAGPLARDTRVHVAINPATLTGVEGALFSTGALAFAEEPSAGAEAAALLCRVEAAPERPRPGILALGGERRMARVGPAEGVEWPTPPAGLLAALSRTSRLRLQLATPAIFERGGWRPDWVDPESLTGSPPGVDGLRLRLVSAAVGRRVPVSGWSLDRTAGRYGPKATRYAVPAGSVFFFEVDGEPPVESTVHQLWMRSICEEEQDRRDGFGLVLVGTWEEGRP